MEYNTYTPSQPLAPYIQCYWTLENDAAGVVPTVNRIFPDGCIELVFHHAGLFKKRAGDSWVEQPGSFIHGQLKQFIEIEAMGRIGTFSVRFRPHGLRPFIPFHVHTVTGRVVPIGEMWGTAGHELEQRMMQAADTHERIRHVEVFLMKYLDVSVDKNNTVQTCVEQIEAASGMLSMDGLASDLCVGRRHLERRFLQHVGLSPKLFARIIRFNRVLHLIEAKEGNSFAHLAQEGGFYDQAHFIKDFKDFTGLNPGSYFSEELDWVKFFNLEK